MVFVWNDKSVIRSFAFTFTVGPTIKFCFDKAAQSTRAWKRPFKRRRPLWDVDGVGNQGKKKRRLRLNLITSRLSRPFSVPATNIVNRGISKIAIWAKGRPMDKNLLRKAAIMNRVRMRIESAKITAHKEQASRENSARQLVMFPKPRCYESSLPPSPLGLSNYDALDLEDETFEDDEDGEPHSSSIYSDFNFMDPNRILDTEDEYYLDALDGIPQCLVDEQPPPPPDDELVELMKERERQKEVCFVKFVA